MQTAGGSENHLHVFCLTGA